MTNSRSAFSLVALAFLWTSCANAGAQKAGTSPTRATQQVLSLNFGNNGQRVAATVGQQIEIRLGAMAPCDPQLSSSAIRLESVALDWPPNPGLMTHVYIFEAATEGQAEVQIPITDCSNPDLPDGLTFAVTIRVGRAHGGRSTPYASRTPDQANTAPWENAWTILQSNVLRQSFTPSLPRLTAVEVELVEANPGPASPEVTMTLLNAGGEPQAVVAKTVPVDACRHVRFILPYGGLRVSPGQLYSIELSGAGSLFGWKYVLGGYAYGAASFNGKPLLQDARSTFLFQTFGAR
jgi:hypothetical protein